MEAIQREIEELGSDKEHRFVAAYDIAIERDGQAFSGKRAFFRDRFDGFSNAFLFEFNGWFVEYRMVFVRDLERIADDFVNNHSWGDLPEPEKKKE